MTEPTSTHTRKRGIYLLPNLFTTTGLFVGFFAIIKAMQGHFTSAATAIFIAMITDFLDGRVARLTQTQTAFGAEYDSLADMVAFGIAPSIVIYMWALSSLGKLGWLAAFLYTASVALRLARFNTQIKNNDKRYFQGLASPSGAGVLASMVLFGSYFIGATPLSRPLAVIVWFVTIAIAGLMVSNIRYRSFKEIDIKGRIPFVALLVIVLIFVGIAIDPPTILLILFFAYAISGPTITLWRLRQARRKRRKRGK